MGCNGRTFQELPPPDICLLPPHSYINLPPLADQKNCKSGGLVCLLTPHSYTIYPPWKPNAAQKDGRVLSCIFLKNPPIAAPLLHHFWAEKFNPGI